MQGRYFFPRFPAGSSHRSGSKRRRVPSLSGFSTALRGICEPSQPETSHCLVWHPRDMGQGARGPALRRRERFR